MNNAIISGDQLTFLDQRFYHKDGQFCPSITTILEAYPKSYGFYKWLKENGEDADKIRDAAGQRGSTVHMLTEKLDQGLTVNLINEQGIQNFSVSEWAMFTRYVEFRNMYKDTIKVDESSIEMRLIDLELKEAGTVDRIMIINGAPYIVDIKTSNNIWDSYWLQVAAYRRLFERSSGLPVAGVGILWLNARTRGPRKGEIQGEGWQLLLKEDTSHELDLFECTKKLWIEQNKTTTPKNVSYKLSHSLSKELAPA